MLAGAFLKLAMLAQNPDDDAAAKELAGIKSELKGLKDGQFFIDQINTAEKVLKEKKS